MIFYSLKQILRNARRNSVMSFAKLFGLSISFFVVLFVAGYVYYETSFDKWIPDHESIFRCLMEGRMNDQDASFAVTSPEMAQTIVADIPEISEAVRLLNRGETSITHNDETFNGGPVFWTDPEFFSFFSVPIITGIDNPLASQNGVVITRSLAENIFGSADTALGKSIKLGGEDAIVTGVFSDLPKNFHLRISLIQSLQKSNPDNVGWGSQNYYTYFKTSKPVPNIEELNFKLTKTVYTYYDNRIDGAKAKTFNDLMYDSSVYVFFPAERLADIHFSNHKFDPAVTSSKIYIYGAVVLAFLVLLISSINFVNLTIANVSTRLREVGIKKTSGATVYEVARFFLFEAVVFLLSGFALALLIYSIIERNLIAFLDFDISLTRKDYLITISLVLIALLILNLAASILPVLNISKKKTLNLIRNQEPVGRSFSVKNVFVISQFFLAVLIILCSFIVQKQINYMINKDRGYDYDNVITLNMWSMNPETRRSFIEQLKTFTVIESVATSDAYFGEDPSMNAAYFGTMEDENYFHTTILPVDYDFINTFKLEMVEGRFFDKDRQTDSKAVVLNETARDLYSGEGSLIGTKVIVDGDYDVIGIVKDFNFRSLHHPIQPLVLTSVDNFGMVYVKISGNRIAEGLSIITEQWEKSEIPIPLHYRFHDEVLSRHYVKDQQAKKLLMLLALIAIAIACVGLYAISFFSIVKRTKEVGVRKVNGASIAEILALLNKDFVKWVAIAFVIATPIAYYAMHKWLQNFAYKTELSWWIFALAGLLALGIALLTVSWQSWRAARRNPVEALRYE
ncbi:MAG: ABC transporter permease [Bacteroidetes bacterium]|jgi:putative ABC transport system permease protein|nr:ABC transporter permease [Bacteroidota bacterium]